MRGSRTKRTHGRRLGRAARAASNRASRPPRCELPRVSPSSGSTMRNVVPAPGLRGRRRPCRRAPRATAATIASPSPTPPLCARPRRVGPVEALEDALAPSSAPRPGPESATSITALPFSARDADAGRAAGRRVGADVGEQVVEDLAQPVRGRRARPPGPASRSIGRSGSTARAVVDGLARDLVEPDRPRSSGRPSSSRASSSRSSTSRLIRSDSRPIPAIARAGRRGGGRRRGRTARRRRGRRRAACAARARRRRRSGAGAGRDASISREHRVQREPEPADLGALVRPARRAA